MIKKLKITEIKMAKFNPKERSEGIDGLVESIEKVGLLYPVLITKQREVVDGHRRIAAYVKLGIEEIPTLQVDGDHEELFAEANGANKRLSGNQAIKVFLEAPRAVGPNIRSACEECENIVGRPMLRRIAKEGFSLCLWRTVRNVARRADQETEPIITQLLKWMMHFGNVHNVRKALSQGMAPGMIIAAAQKMKNIKIKHEIAP